MANRYFSQYLLNEGILTPENAGLMLAKSISVEPDLTVVALEKGLIGVDQAIELEGNRFEEVVLAKKYLTALQLDDLKKAVPERSACLGQVLLNEGIVSLIDLAKLYEASSKAGSQPIMEVVSSLLKSKGMELGEKEHWGDYVELLVGTMQRFMNTDAILLQGGKAAAEADRTYLVSQSMNGALSMTAGCFMCGSVLLTMANRFSGEELTEVDEMAVDCLEEFCNVLNGLYIVNMSGKNMDMDLDMPRTEEDAVPTGADVLSLQVETEFGSWILYMSDHGFIV